MSGTASARSSRSSRSGALEARALALGERQAEPHRVGDRQDVGEQDRRVEREARERLQRHLGRERRASSRARGSCRPARASRCTRAGSARPGASARPACTAWARAAARGGRCRFERVIAGAWRGAIRQGRAPSRRQRRIQRGSSIAHQELVDRARALAALADRPDDERLAAAHVAGREHLGDATSGSRRCSPATLLRASRVDAEAARASPRRRRAGEAHREQHEIGLHRELAVRHLDHLHLRRRRPSRHSTRARDRACSTVPSSPSKRLVATAQSRVAAFLVRRRGAQLDRPVRPRRAACSPARAAAAAARTA